MGTNHRYSPTEIKHALGHAEKALRKEIQKLSFDAHLHTVLKATHPTAKNAHKRRVKLLKAAKILKHLATSPDVAPKS